MAALASAPTLLQAPSGESFFPVKVASLRCGTDLPFGLYLWPRVDRAPVLCRPQGGSFTEETRQYLLSNRIEILFLRGEDEAAYAVYIEQNLGGLLKDDGVDVDTKSTALYMSAKGLVKSVLDDPRAGDVVKRSEDFVTNTTEYMLREPSALSTLMKVSSYDYYTYTHSVNVFVFGVALGRRAGLDEETLKRFAMGAMLHDVGKSEIDPGIVNCPGKLDDAQWASMKRHPALGYDILVEQGVTDELVLDVVRHHHEKINGTGYPDGLKARDVSQFARIAAISDIFDALTTRRSYKEALPSFSALQLMREKMSADLDPDLFKRFILMIGAPKAQ